MKATETSPADIPSRELQSIKASCKCSQGVRHCWCTTTVRLEAHNHQPAGRMPPCEPPSASWACSTRCWSPTGRRSPRSQPDLSRGSCSSTCSLRPRSSRWRSAHCVASRSLRCCTAGSTGCCPSRCVRTLMHRCMHSCVHWRTGCIGAYTGASVHAFVRALMRALVHALVRALVHWCGACTGAAA